MVNLGLPDSRSSGYIFETYLLTGSFRDGLPFSPTPTIPANDLRGPRIPHLLLKLIFVQTACLSLKFHAEVGAFSYEKMISDGYEYISDYDGQETFMRLI
ncbi:hypothetical protein CEXT_465171 [Caerostris extrusa]|uniref:Uncharacterized protein n=1 Tax=Caerostris extrusa TaxID=172846 RepID=A0AAV4WR71_CAEEX|nr:hypothetical protein CEXT_465171 [Caerostris extrusa]